MFQHGMINLNYRMDHNLYQSIPKLCLEYYKKHETFADNSPIIICISKTENGITFKIKTEQYLKRLTLEIIKLLGSTENEITKYKKW